MNLLQRTVEDFTVEVLKITLRLHGVVGCGVEQFIVAVEGSDRTNLNPACGIQPQPQPYNRKACGIQLPPPHKCTHTLVLGSVMIVECFFWLLYCNPVSIIIKLPTHCIQH